MDKDLFARFAEARANLLALADDTTVPDEIRLAARPIAFRIEELFAVIAAQKPYVRPPLTPAKQAVADEEVAQAEKAAARHAARAEEERIAQEAAAASVAR